MLGTSQRAYAGQGGGVLSVFFLTATFGGVVYCSMGRVLARQQALGPLFAAKPLGGWKGGTVVEFIKAMFGLLIGFVLPGYLIVKFCGWLAKNDKSYQEELKRRQEHLDNCPCCRYGRGSSSSGPYNPPQNLTFLD
ncbi:hypothetical protein [Geoalkalibacter sp.]|uniref:hypothetical protein n=1 Tax=Geoalkalibacter sp. TaxID=3041440 RepID=UPI00272EBDA1|nr:hypothetical protein [Geoalkalibacter sp.]